MNNNLLSKPYFAIATIAAIWFVITLGLLLMLAGEKDSPNATSAEIADLELVCQLVCPPMYFILRLEEVPLRLPEKIYSLILIIIIITNSLCVSTTVFYIARALARLLSKKH